MSYSDFISSKRLRREPTGFDPIWMPDFLFDFQKYLVEWSLVRGRSAIFADCGLGKTPIALVWAQNVVQKTNGRVLIVCPLAVSYQFINEGDKFGITVTRSKDGRVAGDITVTNYERLHHFNPGDFDGVVVDESSILKNFDGKFRRLITDFVLKIKYCLLDTATPAPNDYMELGTSSEAIGVMSRNQMLGMFFTNSGKTTSQWELKGHGRLRFWQWMATWSRAVRRPSDLGFDDGGFILPGLEMEQHVLKSSGVYDGFFPKLASTLKEQNEERRSTVKSRCEKVAELVPTNGPALVWCHRNVEGDLLSRLIPGAVQVSGSDTDDYKESMLRAFSDGEARVLVTKPKIAGFGLNWQHCSWMSFFPSHSYESFYQALRRCLRFGQTNVVKCCIVTTERERVVLSNMIEKEAKAAMMYDRIVRCMNDAVERTTVSKQVREMEAATWM